MFNKGTKKKRKSYIKEHHFLFIEALFDNVVDEILKWQWASWWPQDSCLSYEIDDDKPETGKSCRLVLKMKFLKIVLKGEIVRVRPRKALQFTWHSGLMTGQEFVIVEERSNGTRIDHRSRYTGANVMTHIIWKLFLRKRYDECIAQIFDALKQSITQTA